MLVFGVMSPYPTLVIVTMENQNMSKKSLPGLASPTLSKVKRVPRGRSATSSGKPLHT